MTEQHEMTLSRMSIPGTPERVPAVHPQSTRPQWPGQDAAHMCPTRHSDGEVQSLDDCPDGSPEHTEGAVRPFPEQLDESPGHEGGVVVDPVDDSPDSECTPRPEETEKTTTLRNTDNPLLRKDHDIRSDASIHSGSNSRSSKLSPNQGVFGGATALKQSVYQNLAQREYTVHDFYDETGYVQAIARSEKFSSVTLAVIAFNAIWIGIDTDHNNAETLADADTHFKIGEHFFCTFFCFEWVIRFLAFAKKRDCLRDGWFKFDSVLVGLMVLETWIIPIFSEDGDGLGDASMLRLLRLLRLTRMARLMRSVPELVTLLKGMAAATRSVFSTLVLLVLFMYVFAIVFKQQCAGLPRIEPYFSDIPTAMWNLLIFGTFMDNIGIILHGLGQSSYAMTGLFLLFVLIASFTILNMLIGVLCEVVSSVSHAEREKVVVSFVKQKLFRMLEAADTDNTGTISQEEFQIFLENDEVCAALKELQVDVPNLATLTEVLFAVEEHNDRGVSPLICGDASFKGQSQDVAKTELTFHDLLEKILQLRSTNTSTVTDIVDVRKFIQNNNRKVYARFDDLAIELATLKEDQKHLVDTVASLAKSVDKLLDRSSLPSPQRSHCQHGNRSLRESAGASPIRAPTQSGRKTLSVSPPKQSGRKALSTSPPRRRRLHKVDR